MIAENKMGGKMSSGKLTFNQIGQTREFSRAWTKFARARVLVYIYEYTQFAAKRKMITGLA